MSMLSRDEFIAALNDAVAQARLRQCADLSGLLATDAALRAELEAVRKERDEAVSIAKGLTDIKWDKDALAQ